MRLSKSEFAELEKNGRLDDMSVDEQITALSDQYVKSRKAKISKKLGQIGEGFAKSKLIELGLARVERIETGWTVIFGKGGKPVNAFPNERVSGDFKAIVPVSGRAVHIEVKLREENLRLSHLEKHQIEALDEVCAIGGLSLVCWARENGDVCVMEWPVPGLVPRKSITWEHALENQWSGI